MFVVCVQDFVVGGDWEQDVVGCCGLCGFFGFGVGFLGVCWAVYCLYDNNSINDHHATLFLILPLLPLLHPVPARPPGIHNKLRNTLLLRIIALNSLNITKYLITIEELIHKLMVMQCTLVGGDCQGCEQYRSCCWVVGWWM